jgi:glycosyltransferase involved in cell wall biosynthesis
MEQIKHMNKLTIGIPTYQRPAMLEKLVHSIFACRLDSQLIQQIDVLIVDNDADKTAEETVKSFLENPNPNFQVHYSNFPIKGLSNVRNEIIRQAMDLEPDYIVFIDDDEYVTTDWLLELLKTVINNKGDFALGPVVPEFEKKVPPAIAQWFTYYPFPDQKALDFIDSGNLIMRTQFLKDQQLLFDGRFNTLGAEDSYFGVTALKKGATVFWAKKAIAYENIPEKRSTLNWLIKRRFRGANTYTYIIFIEKKYGQVAKKILVNFIYLLVGLAALVLTPFPFKYRYYGVLKIAESLGSFAGLLNIRFHEYLKGR